MVEPKLPLAANTERSISAEVVLILALTSLEVDTSRVCAAWALSWMLSVVLAVTVDSVRSISEEIARIWLAASAELVVSVVRTSSALPAMAALGGMVVPAVVFFALNAGGPASHGWGIPMATDIAFAVSVVTLLGRRVPLAARTFLLTLAVADDIGGIVVIAIFYTSGLHAAWLAGAVVAFAGALDLFYLDTGRYPMSQEGLGALVQRSAGLSTWNGPYLKKPAIPKDPWGNPYQYKCCPGDHGDYDIWSYGADNSPGGEGENADVTSWDVK